MKTIQQTIVALAIAITTLLTGCGVQMDTHIYPDAHSEQVRADTDNR